MRRRWLYFPATGPTGDIPFLLRWELNENAESTMQLIMYAEQSISLSFAFSANSASIYSPVTTSTELQTLPGGGSPVTVDKYTFPSFNLTSLALTNIFNHSVTISYSGSGYIGFLATVDLTTEGPDPLSRFYIRKDAGFGNGTGFLTNPIIQTNSEEDRGSGVGCFSANRDNSETYQSVTCPNFLVQWLTASALEAL